MSVSEKKNLFYMAIDKYGFNKVLTIFAISMGAALISAGICVNVIPNDKEKENN